MVVPKRPKVLSLIIKTIVILSAVIGTVLSTRQVTEFMSGSTVFMYFTIQSNLAIALICLAGAFFLIKNKDVNNIWYVIKFVATVAITLTGVVFCVVLAPTLKQNAWTPANILTHVVVPVFSIADYYITCAYGALRKRHVFYVIIPPLLYALYAGIGFANNWDFGGGRNYPYFFLDWGSPAGAIGFTNKLPFMGCVWWILLLLVFLIFIGLIYVTTLNKYRTNRKPR